MLLGWLVILVKEGHCFFASQLVAELQALPAVRVLRRGLLIDLSGSISKYEWDRHRDVDSNAHEPLSVIVYVGRG